MSKKITEVPFERFSHGDIINNYDNQQRMRDLLNSKGPGFCLAKWTQVTMHLGVGLTHSCHHPVAHKIPIDELKTNPSALHNTQVKKEARKQMLNGERPDECDFCWRIEDNTGEISDRTLKSMSQFSHMKHDEIVDLNGDEDVYPTYVEISFSHACNFKCSYCGPTFSSKWAEEIKQHGVYKIGNGGDFNWTDDVPLKASDDNPYTEAFWKWFPDALPHMQVLRITGGEPLMSKHTFGVMDYLLENPNPELVLAVNSNGCPPDKLWDKFIEKVKALTESGSIKRFTLFTSAESSEGQAEYSRYGMDWNVFKRNIERFLEETVDTRVTFMAAFNILSIPTMKDFVEYALFLRRRFNNDGMYNWLDESGINLSNSLNANLGKYQTQMPSMKERMAFGQANNRVGLDIPYVRAPDFLDASICTIQLLEQHLLPAVDYMFHNLHNEWHGMFGFEQWEALKLKRIFVDCLIACKDARNPDETTSRPDIATKRARFYKFIEEYDRRRGTDFLKTFPEMRDFYHVCELEYQKLQDKDE